MPSTRPTSSCRPLGEIAHLGLVGEVALLGVDARAAPPRGRRASSDRARRRSTRAPAASRARAAARPAALVPPASSTSRPCGRAASASPARRRRGRQASAARIPAVDSITGRIFFSSASKNIESGNSSSITASVYPFGDAREHLVRQPARPRRGRVRRERAAHELVGGEPVRDLRPVDRAPVQLVDRVAERHDRRRHVVPVERERRVGPVQHAALMQPREQQLAAERRRSCARASR